MHRGPNYVTHLLGSTTATKDSVRTFALNLAQAGVLADALRVDARDYYYSACQTFAAAVGSVSRGSYTWATVELYYCVFYALRAFLASQGLCIFYVQGAAYSLTAKDREAGGSLRESSTHKCVFKEFRRFFPNHLLVSQQIDASDPLEWLVLQREIANYKKARFTEPDVPTIMLHLEGRGLRRSLNTYLDDDENTYTFDADHAVAAFALRALRETRAVLHNSLVPHLDADEVQAIRGLIRDDAGALQQVASALV